MQDGDDEFGFSNSIFQTGHVQARADECGFSNSLFQTGSGKLVNISSDGLARAKTLLGLEEDNGPPIVDASASRSLVICKTDFGQSRFKNEAEPQFMQFTMQNSAPKPPPIKFHTAGGRSLSVSSDALQRARSLLGDPELGTLSSEGDANDSVFAFPNGRRFDDCSLNEENESRSSLSYQEMAKSKHESKIFVSPLRSSSNQLHLSLKSGTTNLGANLINQFDAVDDDNVCRPNSNTTCLQKPLSNGSFVSNKVVDNSLANGTALRKNPVGMSQRGHLVDISNTIGTISMGIKQPTNERKRIGRTSISPFKRPRSCKFTTPVNKNIPFAPKGKFNSRFYVN